MSLAVSCGRARARDNESLRVEGDASGKMASCSDIQGWPVPCSRGVRSHKCSWIWRRRDRRRPGKWNGDERGGWRI